MTCGPVEQHLTGMSVDGATATTRKGNRIRTNMMHGVMSMDVCLLCMVRVDLCGVICISSPRVSVGRVCLCVCVARVACVCVCRVCLRERVCASNAYVRHLATKATLQLDVVSQWYRRHSRGDAFSDRFLQVALEQLHEQVVQPRHLDAAEWFHDPPANTHTHAHLHLPLKMYFEVFDGGFACHLVGLRCTWGPRCTRVW